MGKALFGPGGNSLSFYKAGYKSTLFAPEWVNSIGLDAYEYQGGNGITASSETLAAIGKRGFEQGIQMSLHAPYFISLSSVEPEKRLKSIDYIKKSAQACRDLNAGIMVVHTGSAAKISREQAMSYAAETLDGALAMMEENRFDAKIGLETMGKENQLGTLAEVLKLCKLAAGRLVPVVDFGHLNAREGGSLKTTDDYKRIFDSIANSLGGEYAETLHCHFSHIEYTGKGEKKHLTFEDTEFGPFFEPLGEAIVALGVCPTVICESDGTMAEDALKMKQAYFKIIDKEV